MRNISAILILLFVLTSCKNPSDTPNIREITRIVEVTKLISEQESSLSGIQFPPECLTRQPGIDYTLYDWLYSTTIGGCSFLVPSPNGKYIAFSTLICLSKEECGEAVKVLGLNSEKSIIIQYIPRDKILLATRKWVANISWSFRGDLVISHNNIDRGTGVYIFSEPFVENMGDGEETVNGGIHYICWICSRIV
jgi:hypothetical protein